MATRTIKFAELEKYIVDKTKSYKSKSLLSVLLRLIQDIKGYSVEIIEDYNYLIFYLYEYDKKVETLINVLHDTQPHYAKIDPEHCCVRFKYFVGENNKEQIIISEGKYELVGWKNDSFNYIVGKRMKSETNVVIYGLKDIYKGHQNKFYPSKLHDFSISQLTINLLNILAEEHIFFKDIVDNYILTNYLPNRKICDCYKFYSKKNMLESFKKYKQLDLPKSINKYTLEEATLICDILVLLSRNDQTKVFQLKREYITKILKNSQTNSERVKEFFLLHWKSNGMIVSDKILYILSDYIRLKDNFKQPLSLNKISEKKIIEEHNKLAFEYKVTKVKALKIPNDSKFNNLKLPKEYERIKTKRRLIQEGILQNHCVATYDGFINKDECAIYSIVYENIRYTIDIRMIGKKFVCTQFIGAYNNIYPPKTLRDNLKEHLSNSNSKKVKCNT